MNQRTRPEGWPVGSFDTYAKAQAAVDMLSDHKFDVGGISIVGVDLMEVERVLGRLTWGRVLVGGAASGAWLGLFFGLLMGIVTDTWGTSLIMGMGMGMVFFMVLSAAQYAMTQGRKDFSSATEIVAGRYDVLCPPDKAPKARDMIADFLSASGKK